MRPISLVIALLLPLSWQQVQSQWVQTNGPNGGDVWALAKSGKNLYAGTELGVYLSTDNGRSWTEASSGLPTNPGIFALAISGNHLLAGTSGGGVYYSTDSGTSWLFAPGAGFFVLSFAVSDTVVFAGTYDGGVDRSTNSGTIWSPVNNNLTDAQVFAVAFSGTSLVAGTYSGVWVSNNYKISWNRVNSGPVDQAVSSFAVGGADLFAGAFTGVFLSTDNGTSWTGASSGLTFKSVQCLAVSPTPRGSGTNLFAGTYGGGVYYSANKGASWTEVNSGLTDSTVLSIFVSDTLLFAGTRGGRLWRRPLSEMVTSVGPTTRDLPREFFLQQNYPNPFNPTTEIQFTIVNSLLTIVKVYDLLGREVATLMNEVKQPGAYTVRWDAEGVASGVYFYRLAAGNYVQTKRMVLLK